MSEQNTQKGAPNPGGTYGELPIMEFAGMHLGYMVSGSKSYYLNKHPKNLVVFNANVVSEKEGKKIWWGDIDITKKEKDLQEFANKHQDTLYILREMHCRFESENNTMEQHRSNAIHTVKPTK